LSARAKLILEQTFTPTLQSAKESSNGDIGDRA